MTEDHKIHIFYDNNCSLCIRFKDSLKYFCGSSSPDSPELDIYEFHGIHHEETKTKFPSLDLDKCKEELHILTEDKVWLTAGEAFNYLIKSCPKVENFKWLIEGDAGKKATEVFYSVSDHLRRRIKSRCKTCGKA